MGLLALRPGDLLTILKMALSIGFRSSISFLSAIQATGTLTFSPVGLSPTEHASLCWTRDLPSLLPAHKGSYMPDHSAPCVPASRSLFDYSIYIQKFCI
jgi:hypothetical protein